MALAVAGLQPPDDRGVPLGEASPERVGAHGLPIRIGLFANRGWHVGNGGDALHQGAQIEAGSSTQDRRPAFRQATRDLGRGKRPPARRRQRLAERHHAVECMRHTRTLLGAGLGGQNRKGVVGLHGIGVDHRARPFALAFALETFRQRKRQRRLAARGRSGDDDDAPLSHGGRKDTAWPLIANRPLEPDRE